MQKTSSWQKNFNETVKAVLPQRKYFPIWLLKLPIMIFYKKIFGRRCNFKNPKYFTEKIQRYQLYYDNPDFSRICDKAKFKDYVCEKIGDGYTAKLYGVWDNVDDIEIDKLPNSFVLKSNCSSESKNIIIVKNKSKFDFGSRKKEIKKWLNPKNTAVSSYSRCYWDVKPMIMAEEFLASIGDMPVDYKFYCFNGKPYCVNTIAGRIGDTLDENPDLSFYDLDWNLLNVRRDGQSLCVSEKPKHFDDMINFAEALSKDFPFVRVDFYDTDEQLYVGELTFYPAGGFKKFNPDSFDLELGEKFVIANRTS